MSLVLFHKLLIVGDDLECLSKDLLHIKRVLLAAVRQRMGKAASLPYSLTVRDWAIVAS